MGGSFLQLVAKGGQDLPLTGNQEAICKSTKQKYRLNGSELIKC